MSKRNKKEHQADKKVYVKEEDMQLLVCSCNNCFERMQIDNTYCCPCKIQHVNRWNDESEECLFYRREPLKYVIENGRYKLQRMWRTPNEKRLLYIKYGMN